MTGLDIVEKLKGYGVPESDAKILAATSYGESGYDPKAYGDRNLGGSYGLFQIHIPAHYDKLIRWTGSTNRDDWVKWLENPENNIYAGSQVYKSQGLGAWSVYKSGAYKPYMNSLDTLTVAGGGGDSKPSLFEEAKIPWYKRMAKDISGLRVGSPTATSKESLGEPKEDSAGDSFDLGGVIKDTTNRFMIVGGVVLVILIVFLSSTKVFK